MNTKISVFFDHLLQAQSQTGKSLEEILSFIKEQNISGIDINCNFLSEHMEIYTLLKKYDFQIACIYETHDYVNSEDFSSSSKHIDLAAQTGSKNTLFIPGYFDNNLAQSVSKLNSYDETKAFMENNTYCQRIVRMLTKAVSYGTQKGITITLEDYDGFTSPCSRTNNLMYFMEKVPGLKHTFDMGNFAYSNESNQKAYEKLSKYISHVHCKDRGLEPEKKQLEFNKGLACVPVGKGYMDISSLVQKIKASKYNGYYTIEHFDAQNQLSYIKQSADFLNKLLNK